jgi:hypothetical protein
MCTTIVFDQEPTPAITQFGCSVSCNPDAASAHPPQGLVTWTGVDSSGGTGELDNQAGTCKTQGLQTGPSASSPRLTYIRGATPGVPAQIPAQPDYAAWCTTTFQVPPGVVQIRAHYLSETSLGSYTPPAHAENWSLPVQVTDT